MQRSTFLPHLGNLKISVALTIENVDFGLVWKFLRARYVTESNYNKRIFARVRVHTCSSLPIFSCTLQYSTANEKQYLMYELPR